MLQIELSNQERQRRREVLEQRGACRDSGFGLEADKRRPGPDGGRSRRGHFRQGGMGDQEAQTSGTCRTGDRAHPSSSPAAGRSRANRPGEKLHDSTAWTRYQMEELSWCGRRELNPHGLAACGFSYRFGFRRPARGGFVVWTIPSPFLIRGLGAARLVSTPSRKCFRAWLGIAIAGFPEFGQFYSAGFPMGTQAFKSAASAISPRPHEIATASS